MQRVGLLVGNGFSEERFLMKSQAEVRGVEVAVDAGNQTPDQDSYWET